ncbi:hypothetical protein D3C87_1921420 [compost metagenome]
MVSAIAECDITAASPSVASALVNLCMMLSAILFSVATKPARGENVIIRVMAVGVALISRHCLTAGVRRLKF